MPNLTVWCSANNHILKIKKNKETAMECMKTRRTDLGPVLFGGEAVERVTSFKFLGVHINEDFCWVIKTSRVPFQ